MKTGLTPLQASMLLDAAATLLVRSGGQPYAWKHAADTITAALAAVDDIHPARATLARAALQSALAVCREAPARPATHSPDAAATAARLARMAAELMKP